MNSIVIAIAILAVTCCFYFVYLKPKRQIQMYRKYFQDKGYRTIVLPIMPMFSSLFKQLAVDTLKGDSFHTLKYQHCNYDVALGNIKGKIRISLYSPKLIRQYCRAEMDYKLIKAKITSKNFQKLAKGLVFSENQSWKKKRRIMSNIFNHQFVSKMLPRIAEIFQRSLSDIQIKYKQVQKTCENKYKVLQYTSSGASSVIMECFLGCDARNQLIQGQTIEEFLIPLLDDFVQSFMDPLAMVFGQKFVKLGLREKDRYLYKRLKMYDQWGSEFIQKKVAQFNEKIKESQQQFVPGDLIDAILLTNKKSIDKGELSNVYSHKQILDEFKIFLLAGTDTTAHYLQMMIFYTLKNSGVESKIRQQIDTFMGNDDYSVENLKKLRYMQAVMKQTTRMYGPANFVFLRQAAQDFYLDGIPIKKETYLGHFSMAVHYSESVYKNPFQFRPQRWLNGECDNNDAYSHIGFSVGIRSCIGKQLALFEAKIGMIKFFKRYNSIKIPVQKIKYFFKFAYTSENFVAQMESNKGIHA